MASKRDSIVTALIAVLNTITVTNGYNTNLSTGTGGGGAVKPDSVRNQLAVTPVVLVSVPSEDKDTGDTSRHSYIRNRLSVELVLYIGQDGTTPVEDQIDDLVEDVERILLGANLDSPPLSVTGLEEIRLQGHLKFTVDEESLDGALMSADFYYRHDQDDPRTYGGL